MYDESNDAKILFSIINENDNSIELGLLRNTSLNNALDIYIDGTAQSTIESNDLNWSTVSFNLITITSDKSDDGSNTSIIKVFINDQSVHLKSCFYKYWKYQLNYRCKSEFTANLCRQFLGRSY